MTSHERKREEPEKVDLGLNLGGILKGLGNLLDLASDLAEKAEKFKGGTVREGRGQWGSPRGVQAVYGFSVRVGEKGRPIVDTFGNVREEAGKGPVVEDVREPMTDLLDEGEYLALVAELPGIEEKDVHWELNGDVLIIRAESSERKYYKELLLSAPVDEQKATSSYKNGILEIRLAKQ